MRRRAGRWCFGPLLASVLATAACPSAEDCTRPARCDGNVVVKCGRTACPSGTRCWVPPSTNVIAYCVSETSEPCATTNDCSGDAFENVCVTRNGVETLGWSRCGLDTRSQDHWRCVDGACKDVRATEM